MNDYLETRELYHFGIKGQKWGVRRFENEDGTLTNAGKKKLESNKEIKDIGKRRTNRFLKTVGYGSVGIDYDKVLDSKIKREDRKLPIYKKASLVFKKLGLRMVGIDYQEIRRKQYFKKEQQYMRGGK